MQLLVGPPLRALRARVGVVLRVPGVGIAGSPVSACAALACVHVFTRCFLCENLKQMPTFFYVCVVCVCVCLIWCFSTTLSVFCECTNRVGKTCRCFARMTHTKSFRWMHLSIYATCGYDHLKGGFGRVPLICSGVSFEPPTHPTLFLNAGFFPGYFGGKPPCDSVYIPVLTFSFARVLAFSTLFCIFDHPGFCVPESDSCDSPIWVGKRVARVFRCFQYMSWRAVLSDVCSVMCLFLRFSFAEFLI